MREAGTCLLFVAAVAGVTGAQALALEQVLDRAATYVATYRAQLAGVVAEEQYRQQMIGGSASRRPQHRQLRSDVLLVMAPGSDSWLQFRDVFEVDRRPIRDRDQRLYQLFVEARPSDWRQQMQTIQRESARYNIGPLERTINIPIMALQFFERALQARSKFSRARADVPKSVAALAPRADVWVIDFDETGPGTLVQGPEQRDLPSTGRAWIDSRTGRILRTRHVTGDTWLRAEVDVTYRNEPGIDVLVPAEMRETYALVNAGATITGRATYGRFRQFTVRTTERPKQ